MAWRARDVCEIKYITQLHPSRLGCRFYPPLKHPPNAVPKRAFPRIGMRGPTAKVG